MKKTLLIVVLSLALVACSMALMACDNLFGDKECDDHQMDEWYEYTPATCTADGVRRRDCKNCDFYQTEAIPAAHSFGEWIIDVAAKCESSGTRHHICTVCDFSEDETVTALGHDYSIIVSSSAATCGQAGSKLMRCSRCDSTENQVIPATEQHDYENNVCSVCGAAKASEGLNLGVNSDNASAYVYDIGSCTDTDIVIPATYKGLPITEIRQFAFQNNTKIHSVVIPDSVQTIGLSSFSGCTNLASITFGSGLEQICGGAFLNCKALSEIVIPDSVTKIESGAFRQCSSLRSVILGDGVTYIGPNAFEDCTYLKTFILGNSVDIIDSTVFQYTSGIDFNKYDNAYYLGSEENPYMWLWKTEADTTSCEIHKDTKYIAGNLSKVTEIVIPDGVVKITNSVFSGNSSLTTVVIPDSVTSIGQRAFSSCENLTTVIIGSGIKLIDWRAFNNCNKNLKLCYNGTVEDWNNNNVRVADGNPTQVYYSESYPYDVSPDDKDYNLIMNREYWHYGDDGETVIIWSKSKQA